MQKSFSINRSKTTMAMTKSLDGDAFKVLSRCFLRVITNVENENCFFSTLENLIDTEGSKCKESSCY